MILGDLNFHVNTPDEPSSKKYLETLTTFDLIQHVNFPTQICGNTLDHIITRGDLGVTNLRIDATVASDHRGILFQISSPRPGHPKQRLQYRSWSKVDVDAFSGELSSCFVDFSPVSLTSAVDAYNNGNIKLASRRAKKVTYFGHKLSEKNKFPRLASVFYLPDDVTRRG